MRIDTYPDTVTLYDDEIQLILKSHIFTTTGRTPAGDVEIEATFTPRVGYVRSNLYQAVCPLTTHTTTTTKEAS